MQLPQPIYTHSNQKTITPPLYVNEEFMEWLGYWYGDGCYENNRDVSFVINLGDEDVYELIFQRTCQWFGMPYERPSRRYSRELKSSTVVGVRWMQGLGINKEAVPEWINDLSIDLQCAFVRGIMEADGCIWEQTIPKLKRKLGFTNKSNSVVTYIANLFTSLRITHARGTVRVNEINYHVLTVNADSYLSYQTYVNFLGVRKITGLENVLNRKRTDRHNTVLPSLKEVALMHV